MNFFLTLTLFDVTSYSDINYLLGGFLNTPIMATPWQWIIVEL